MREPFYNWETELSSDSTHHWFLPGFFQAWFIMHLCGTVHKCSQVNQPPGEVQIPRIKAGASPSWMLGLFRGFCQDWCLLVLSPMQLYKHRESLSDLQSTIIKHISKDKYITFGHGHTPKHRHITTAKTPALTYTLLNMQSFLKYKQDLQLNKRKMWGWGKEFYLSNFSF